MRNSALIRAGRSLSTMTRDVSNKASSTSWVTRIAVKPAVCHSDTSSVCKLKRVSEFELAEWLIERQKARIVHQRTRERGALGHAARKLVRIGVCKAMQSDKIERGVDALLLLLENAARVEPGRNIVPDRRPRKSVGSWKTRMREGSGRSTSDPSAVMLPAVGCSRPEMSRSKVDLPQPDGPSKAMNSPAATERSMESKHLQLRAGKVESMADAANANGDALRRLGAHLARLAQYRRTRGHQIKPFCQLSSRSRATNRSFTRPAQISAMMISVA